MHPFLWTGSVTFTKHDFERLFERKTREKEMETETKE